MRKVLMLAHRIPYPPNKGDKIRTYNVLRQITGAHECHLAFLVDSDADLQYLPLIESQVSQMAWARTPSSLSGKGLRAAQALLGGHSLSQALLHDPGLHQTLRQWVREHQYHAVVCTAAPMAAYLDLWSSEPAQTDRPRLLMDFIDVDSTKWAQYAQRAQGPMRWIYAREAKQVAVLEQQVLDSFDHCFLVTEQEVALLDPQGQRANLKACGNGVDLDFFNPEAVLPAAVSDPAGQVLHPGQAQGPWVVFTGVMDYLPNIEGIQWFVKEVWPAVQAAVPDAQLAIVGSRPTPEVSALAGQPGVVVTGFVEDVRVWLKAAAVCVAPLHLARGIQNKVLEAMAMAKPVVCTPAAFEGIQARLDVELCVASTAPQFAESVVSLLGAPEIAKRIGHAARLRMESDYRWDAQLRALREVLA